MSETSIRFSACQSDRVSQLPMHGSYKELGAGLMNKILKDLGLIAYPIKLEPDDNGTLLVTCPALPEVTTFGEDEAEAIKHARDAIQEAIAARMANGREVPEPKGKRRVLVTLPMQTSLKVELYRLLTREKYHQS